MISVLVRIVHAEDNCRHWEAMMAIKEVSGDDENDGHGAMRVVRRGCLDKTADCRSCKDCCDGCLAGMLMLGEGVRRKEMVMISREADGRYGSPRVRRI